MNCSTIDDTGVTILLGNSKGPVESGNPNTCTEVKLYMFIFIHDGFKNSLLLD